jgi:hypothetical protein
VYVGVPPEAEGNCDAKPWPAVPVTVVGQPTFSGGGATVIVQLAVVVSGAGLEESCTFPMNV